MVAYNCQLGRDALVEKIILDNPDSYDPIKLGSILHSRQMYYLQCYLFSKGILSQQIDYYTPFLKIYSAYKDKNDPKVGLACLWFLRKCFLLEQIPEGNMTYQEKIQVSTTFLIQILQKSIMSSIYSINQQITLEIFLLPLLNPQFRQIINIQNNLIMNLYNQYHQPLPLNNIIDVILNCLYKASPNKSNRIWSEFLALAFYGGCQTKSDTLIDILIVFFEDKKTDYILNNKKLLRPKFEDLQVKIVETLKPHLINKKNRIHLNKLLSFNQSNVNYLFQAMDQNYKMAIQNYLRTQPRNNIFNFVKSLIQEIDNFDQQSLKQRKKKQIKQYFTKHITTLFQIDNYQALNTYYLLGFSTQKIYQIMQKNLYPKIDFLTAVLERFKDEDFQAKQQYLLEHFSQICELPKNKMLQYLDKFYYPLDPVINISEQKGNFLAKAIFQQRNGRPQDAFKSYERLIKNKVQTVSGKPHEIKKQVQNYVQHCIEICKQYSGSNDGNNFWLQIIRFLSSYIQSDHQHKVYLKVQFQRLLQYVLTQMFAFLPTTLLIDFFIRKDTNLDLSFKRELQIYDKIFILVKFDISMLHRVSKLCKIDLKDNKKEHYLLNKRGLISNGVCNFCQAQLQSQNRSNIYWCKHSFHIYCHDDTSKCLSCYYESDDTIISNAIYQTKKSKIIASVNQINQKQNKANNKKIDLKNIFVQSIASAKLQQKKKKMKLYDFESNNLTLKCFQEYFI